MFPPAFKSLEQGCSAGAPKLAATSIVPGKISFGPDMKQMKLLH
jgi:hypothetical protein